MKKWLKGLRKPCRRSHFLIFSLGLAFAAPTLRFYTSGTGILFNLAGESGGGKTSILLAMQSMMAKPENQKLADTDITAAGLEEKSVDHNDLFFCLDEFGAALSNPKVAPTLINTLAYKTREGRGKSRSTSGQRTLGFDHASWAVSVLTSSEKTIDELLGEETRQAGAEVRYIELLVPEPKHGGAFGPIRRTFPNETWVEHYARRIIEVSSANYGLALPAFIDFLISDQKSRQKIVQYHDEFFVSLRQRAPTEQRRYIENFAKIYAAGRLAVEYGVAPFGLKHLADAVTGLFDNSARIREARGVSRTTAINELIGLGNDVTRCARLTKKGQLVEGDGFSAVRYVRNGVELMFVPRCHATTSSRLAKVLDTAVCDYLVDSGVLHTRGTIRTTQLQVNGLVKGQSRVSGYTVDWAKLEALAVALHAQKDSIVDLIR